MNSATSILASGAPRSTARKTGGAESPQLGPAGVLGLPNSTNGCLAYPTNRAPDSIQQIPLAIFVLDDHDWKLHSSTLAAQGESEDIILRRREGFDVRDKYVWVF